MSFAENDGDYHGKQNKPDWERQIACFLLYEESRFKKKNMKEKRRTIWEEKEGQG
jgi:hypothetical protein